MHARSRRQCLAIKPFFDMKPQTIAVYLPQFHPIAENDRWWGRGFTEWTNVAKAKPLFKGHFAPRLPGELGFYDLRVPEVREAQAALAREHGIAGFCYYHYWFNGHRLLNRPIDDVMASGKPDFPFCLCWANENWSRTWNGADREVLMAQRYSTSDDEAHIRFLLPMFADQRYIRVGGKPLFIVYKTDSLPDPRRTFDTWRTAALRAGVGELCLARFEWSGADTFADPRDDGLDLAIEFAPDWRNLGGSYFSTRKSKLAISLGLLPKAYANHRICDYRTMVANLLEKPPTGYPFVRCVSPGFDNSARRSRGATILVNGTPENYEEWLVKTLAWTSRHNAPQHQLVFINAWNEWAEGNHIEPDTRHGRAYLEATQRALATHEAI